MDRGRRFALAGDGSRPDGLSRAGLAKRFGVEMSTGAMFDPANAAEDRPSSLMFTQENKLLGRPRHHARGDESERISRVRTFTGQSLKGPPGSMALMKLADTAIDHVNDEEVSAAGRSQGLRRCMGKAGWSCSARPPCSQPRSPATARSRRA